MRHANEVAYNGASGAFVMHSKTNTVPHTTDMIRYDSNVFALVVVGLAIVPALVCYLMFAVLAESVAEPRTPLSSSEEWLELAGWLFSTDWKISKLLRLRRLLACFG